MAFTPPQKPAIPDAVIYLSKTQPWPPPAPHPTPKRTDENYLRLKVPIRVVSEANQHEHWRVRAARVKDQQTISYYLLCEAQAPWTFPVPAKVLLTRYAHVRMDSDNLAGSFKHIQDAIAVWLGVDDGDFEYVEWQYNQTIVPRDKPYEVEIELWWQQDRAIPTRPPRCVPAQLRSPKPAKEQIRGLRVRASGPPSAAATKPKTALKSSPPPSKPTAKSNAAPAAKPSANKAATTPRPKPLPKPK